MLADVGIYLERFPTKTYLHKYTPIRSLPLPWRRARRQVNQKCRHQGCEQV